MYERSVKAPSIATAVKLADALGVSVDSLLGRAPLPPGESEKEGA